MINKRIWHNIENKKMVIILLIVLILVVVSIGTYAWFIWLSKDNTELTLTIGELADVSFNTGDDINVSNIGPVLNYLNDGEVTNFSIRNKSKAELLTNINLNITNLPEELKEESFKYILLSSTDNIHFEEVTSGSFVDKNVGVLSLVKEEPTPLGTTYYKFIIYIDGNIGNPTDMMGKSFSGKLEVDVSEKMTGAEYIESLLASNPETMNNDDPNRNVRYMGANPNNYVSFNNELWRIIGVFKIKSSSSGQNEKRIKIIRNESIREMTWDDNNSNNWSTSTLQQYLNNDFYNSVSADAQNMIDDSVWRIGGSEGYLYDTNGLPYHFYQYERGNKVYENNPTYWIGKIGLLYPSDYGYATSGGSYADRSTCLNKAIFNWRMGDYADCKNNDYLYIPNSTFWTITSFTSYSMSVFFGPSGYIDTGHANNTALVLPTLYLKSAVQITGGDGTSENPYTLGI